MLDNITPFVVFKIWHVLWWLLNRIEKINFGCRPSTQNVLRGSKYCSHKNHNFKIQISVRDFAYLLWKIYLNENKKQNMSNNSLLDLINTIHIFKSERICPSIEIAHLSLTDCLPQILVVSDNRMGLISNAGWLGLIIGLVFQFTTCQMV